MLHNMNAARCCMHTTGVLYTLSAKACQYLNGPSQFICQLTLLGPASTHLEALWAFHCCGPSASSATCAWWHRPPPGVLLLCIHSREPLAVCMRRGGACGW